MKKINWLITVLCVFWTAIIITGCKSSYVDNKKENPLGTTSGQANADESETTATQNETDEEETTDTEDDLKRFSMSEGLAVYCLDEEEAWMNAFYNPANIKENKNEFLVQLDCSPDKSLGWSEIPVRLYVTDNGNLIPFTLENGEEKLYHEIEYKAPEDSKIMISVDQSQLSAKNGKLCVIAIYNPLALPGKGIAIFSATAARNFDYVNSGFNGENTVSIADAKGEYIEVPEESNYLDMEEIGPDNIYSIGLLHIYEDVKVNNLSELYMYINSGKKYSEKQIVGIICDGELLKFEEGS